MSAGRFAPSPTSALHVGNLRTALLAWLFARSSGREFRIRVEDLDRARVAASEATAEQQIADLVALGLDFDPPVMFQSARIAAYEQVAAGLEVYECYCTRREIAESVRAPHHSPTAYPGICRDLTEAERVRRRRERPAALRIRAEVAEFTVTDLLHGEVTGEVDDFVIRRNDGAWAYNFVVVVDDLAMGVDQIVRGDDLLSSAPRQAWLTRTLGGTPATYAHVPLVLNAAGQRLAKRDGAVTLADLAAAGTEAAAVRNLLAASVGLAEPGEPVTPTQLVERFDPARLPREPWIFG